MRDRAKIEYSGKNYYILSIALFGLTSPRAMQKKEMADLAHLLEGKTITKPKGLVEKWLRYYADALVYKADSLDKAGKQFSTKITREAAKRADVLAMLPAPGDVKKAFIDVPEWTNLKATRLSLKREAAEILAGQYPNAYKRSRMVKK